MANYTADDDNAAVSDEIFQHLSRTITHDWKDLGRNLGISSSKLGQIQADNVLSQKEQIYQMLRHWKQSNGSAASTYNTLYTALVKSDLTDEKEEVQTMRRGSNSPPGGNGKPGGSNSPPGGNGKPGEAKKNIFISFSLNSVQAVTKLKDRIEKVIGKGSCWICTNEIRGGDILNKKIAKALDNADIVLCMITKDYINSTPCEEEVSVSKSKKKCIIPILLEKMDWGNLKTENGDPPAMQLSLHQLAYINMYDQAKDEDEFKKLIKAIKERSGKST